MHKPKGIKKASNSGKPSTPDTNPKKLTSFFSRTPAAPLLQWRRQRKSERTAPARWDPKLVPLALLPCALGLSSLELTPLHAANMHFAPAVRSCDHGRGDSAQRLVTAPPASVHGGGDEDETSVAAGGVHGSGGSCVLLPDARACAGRAGWTAVGRGAQQRRAGRSSFGYAQQQ